MLRELLDPAVNPDGFGIPGEYEELFRQLRPLPLWFDEEGRMYLPPKQRKPSDKGTTEKITLQSLLGCSPDEADSLVLMVYALKSKAKRVVAGAMQPIPMGAR